MKPTDKIWLDGKMVDWDKAKIHILTHSLHYGTGVYEGIRCYKMSKGSAVFRLDGHINRLFYSANCIGMKVPFSKKEITDAVKKVLKANKVDECYIRPLIFYGHGMALNPTNVPVHVGIAVWPWEYPINNAKALSVSISNRRKLNSNAVPVSAKISGFYSNSVIALLEARKAGFDDTILLDSSGYIAEGPGYNIFIVKNSKLYTPSLGAILPGLTRGSVIKIAKDLRMHVYEKKISVKELKTADEAFFTGTAVEVCPISKINRRKIGNGKPGPVSLKIKAEYDGIIRGRNSKYKKWLTVV